MVTERVCRCTAILPGTPEGVTVNLSVRDRTLWVPLHTGARSIWVNRDWYRSVGGTWAADEFSARALDGNEMVVRGAGSCASCYGNQISAKQCVSPPTSLARLSCAPISGGSTAWNSTSPPTTPRSGSMEVASEGSTQGGWRCLTVGNCSCCSRRRN